jgi:hypothetical protein
MRPGRRQLALASLSLALAGGLLSGCGAGASDPAHRAFGSAPQGGATPGPVHHVAWPAPKLHHPRTIDITAQTTGLKLDPHTDYILRLPRHGAVRAPLGLRINGGHNVVMIGGTVHVPGAQRAMELVDQTGTVHVEGVRFTGSHLIEGIDLSEPHGATVQLENIEMAEVHGSYSTHHADLIQTWAGPKRLLVDGFVGSTDYQGFFLLPNQLYTGPAPKLFDLRNVAINARRGSYALWRQPGFPLRLSNVVVSPNPQHPQRDYWLWPKPSTGDRSWTRVRRGTDPRLRRAVNDSDLSDGVR